MKFCDFSKNIYFLEKTQLFYSFLEAPCYLKSEKLFGELQKPINNYNPCGKSSARMVCSGNLNELNLLRAYTFF